MICDRKVETQASEMQCRGRMGPKEHCCIGAIPLWCFITPFYTTVLLKFWFFRNHLSLTCFSYVTLNAPWCPLHPLLAPWLPHPQGRHLVVKSGTTAGQHGIWSVCGSSWCLVTCTPLSHPHPQVKASSGQEQYYIRSTCLLLSSVFNRPSLVLMSASSL